MAVWLVLVCAQAASAPTRIASLNLCTDSMLFELVSVDRIVSITTLSRDKDLSYFTETAKHLPANHGNVEEVIPLQPDLVVGGPRTAAIGSALLTRLGLKVLTFEPVDSLQRFRENFLRLAEAVGESARAERLLTALASHLDRAGRGGAGAGPVTAVVYQANGYVAGPKTLIGELVDAAGLHNGAVELGLTYGGFVSLERLLLIEPDLIVFSRGAGPYPSLADQLLDHPALRNADALSTPRAGPRYVTIPPQLWSCGGSFVAAAVDRLVLAARPAR
jgi:iron complex transport system substrate-binding protein